MDQNSRKEAVDTGILDVEAAGSDTEVKNAGMDANPDLTIIRTKSQGAGKRPACFATTIHEVLFVAIATLAVAQSSILIGATSGITSYIAKDLSMTQSEVTWITASTALGAGSFLLFFGTVADRFGRRPMLLASLGLYSILCLGTGFSKTPITIDVLCGLLGLCSAASVPPAIGILGATYKQQSKRKNMAFACFSAGNPLGFVAGIFISGVAFKVSTWRTSFWVLAVIYAIFAVLSFWVVPSDEEARAGFNMETLKKFDFIGVILVSAGSGLFTTALTMGNESPEGWKTAYVLVMLILGPILLVLFVLWEYHFQYPLMPLDVWKDKNFTLLISCMCLGFAGFSGNTFWLALFFQKVQGVDPLGIAVRLLPQAIVGVLVNIVAGLIMHRVSNKLLMIIGAFSFTGCFAIFSAYDPYSENSYWKFVFPALCLSVIGADFEFTVTNMYVMSSVKSSQQSVAGGLFNTATRLSTSIGLGITTVAYSSLSTSGSQVSSELLPYRATWWVSLGLCAVSLLLLPFLTISRPGAKRKIEPAPSASQESNISKAQ